MNTLTLITQAQYARLRGVAKSAVHKAVADGRISLINGRIDPAVADIQWQRNTRARPDAGLAGVGGSGPDAAAGAADPPVPDTGYSVDRARRERYEADLAEIKLREQQGDLVRKADVRAEMATRLGDVRTNLLQIPARLAPLLALESDQAKVHAMLDAELRSVLIRLTA